MMSRTGLYIFLVLALLLAGCAPAKSSSVQAAEPDYWPTQGWKGSTPEAQGMDSELLAQMLEEINTDGTNIYSVLVIRHGYVVTEAYFQPYTPDTKMHIQSVTKSVIGALVGIALQKHFISDLDQPLISFFQNRRVARLTEEKSSIQLRHLLSMSSGLDCEEFSSSRVSMEQTADWVQFMLDLPMVHAPGEAFGYCNGNPHLLSAILEKTTGSSTRDFANQELFSPLGIPTVEKADWGEDPQGFVLGGYGLYLRPADLAKIAFLYLQNGKWDGQQIFPAQWVTDSTTQYVQKPEGPGYGYLWTVYPESGRYSALGLAGQQIHVYPAQDLIVVVTAELETFVEAPEIERILNEFILPAIRSESRLAENPEGVSRLQAAVAVAANPIQPVPALPAIAEEISGDLYTLEENPFGWQNVIVFFEPGASTAKISTTGADDLAEVGLDNIYRRARLPENQYLMRGRWADEQTFMIEWTQPGLTNSAEIWLKYGEDSVEITVEQLILGGEPTRIKGIKS
jgi:CubicO group peptidase (beta-lactamase class C family)